MSPGTPDSDFNSVFIVLIIIIILVMVAVVG